jgi:hypothetical protein
VVPLNLPGSQVCRGVGTIRRVDEGQGQEELITNRFHEQNITGAVIPLTQLRRQRRLANTARCSPRGSGRTARLERRHERRPSRGFARFGGFVTEIVDSNTRFCLLKEPPWADVLDTCTRRVATGPNTGRRLAWHSVNAMGAEYFRQRAKDSSRSLIWRQEIVAHVDQTWSANLYLRRSWSSREWVLPQLD